MKKINVLIPEFYELKEGVDSRVLKIKAIIVIVVLIADLSLWSVIRNLSAFESWVPTRKKGTKRQSYEPPNWL